MKFYGECQKNNYEIALISYYNLQESNLALKYTEIVLVLDSDFQVVKT